MQWATCHATNWVSYHACRQALNLNLDSSAGGSRLAIGRTLGLAVECLINLVAEACGASIAAGVVTSIDEVVGVVVIITSVPGVIASAAVVIAGTVAEPSIVVIAGAGNFVGHAGLGAVGTWVVATSN